MACMKPDRADWKCSGSLGKSTSRERNAVERRRRGFYKGAPKGEPSRGVFGEGQRTQPKPASLGDGALKVRIPKAATFGARVWAGGRPNALARLGVF